ncbi:MAG: histidinol-phosphate transaminase [Acidobacteria bacterium]|jgi:histidinol-phosphate aminotransferase|nr:histidinol-phosphate transaminase [Acidobacteriota bacterium]
MESLVNPHVLQTTPYKPGKPVEDIQREFGLTRVIKLASNENMLPIPANVRQAICDELSQIQYYPDSDNYFLRRRIAEYNGVEPDHVIVGAGSVEIIQMLIRAFLKPGERVLTSEKTFSLYKSATIELAGAAAFVETPMDRDLRFDLEAIAGAIDAAAKIIFITNPNNPTGTLLPAAAVRAFIARVPDNRIVVLDNAYQEYVDDPGDYLTGLDEIGRGKNVIVLRTFSKVYGLAGLRVGYALAKPEIIAVLNRVKPPFNVTRVGQRAALESLQSDEFRDRSVRLNRANKAKLFSQLEALRLRVIPSQTNFLLFFPAVDIAALNLRLLQQGVIIRPMGGFGIPDAMRVSVGLEEENDFFIATLGRALQELKK